MKNGDRIANRRAATLVGLRARTRAAILLPAVTVAVFLPALHRAAGGAQRPTRNT